MAELALYERSSCPYCAKVRRTLEELDLEYESIDVPRSNAERTQVKDVSGQTGVPVLVDDAHGVDGMAESADIVSHLETTYGESS